MRMRTGHGRGKAAIVTAAVLIAGAIVTVAGGGTALAAGTITFTAVPADQTIGSLPATVALQATATDSDPTATVTYTAAPLPAGVTIDATTGAITGTVTAAFSGTTTITATDGTNSTPATFAWAAANTLTVASPGTQTDPPGAAITPLQLTGTDTGTGQTLTFASTTLPPGLGISAAGRVTGTPTTAGTFTVTVTDADGTGSPDGTVTFDWTISASTITVKVPAATESTPTTAKVSVQVTAADSAALPVTFASTTLPPGLAINPATGLITGTPTTPGVYDVVISGSDTSGSPPGTAPVTWTVPENTITVTQPANQSSPPKTAVKLQIAATDSDPAQKLAYAAAGLPAGLAINAATGLISGTTSTVFVAATVTVTVTNATSATAAVTFTWSVVMDKITVTAPKAEQSIVGVPLAPLTIIAKDARAGQVLTFSVKNLPAGLALNKKTGVVTGKPTGLTPTTLVTVTATDSTGSAGAAVIRWQVGALITVPDPGARTMTLGQSVDIPFTASSNVAHDTIKIRVRGLPPGVTFQQHPLLLTGWPQRPGLAGVVITATGKDGGITIVRFPIRIMPAQATAPGSPVTLNIGNECLTDPGDSAHNGTGVQIVTCNGSAAQQWQLFTDSTLRIRGKCLGAFGSRVEIWTCGRLAAETWDKGTNAELVNAASGDCLADPGASTSDGTRLTMARCTSGRNQQWTAPGGALRALLFDKCADDHFSSGADGNVIDVFACNGTIAQSWQALPDGTLRIFISKCLTVTGRAGQVGARIELFSCQSGNARQHWRTVRLGGFVTELRNGGACLAVPSNNSPDGTQLRLARCTVTATGPEIGWHSW
jgi:hypothetical protein